MTYTQALMIIRNVTGYTEAEIRKAAAFVLGTFDANEEDCFDAGSALGYADMMNVKATFAPGAHCGDLDDHSFSGAISAGEY